MSYISHPDDHNCCDGGCAQGDECPLHRAPSKRRSVAEFPYAPGRLGSRDYEDDPSRPLMQGSISAIGAAAVVVVVALALFGAGYISGSTQHDRAPPAKARVMT